MEIRSIKKCLLLSGYFFVHVKQFILDAVFIKCSCYCVYIRVFPYIFNIDSNYNIFSITFYI